jgi:hypothetical protein
VQLCECLERSEVIPESVLSELLTGVLFLLPERLEVAEDQRYLSPGSQLIVSVQNFIPDYPESNFLVVRNLVPDFVVGVGAREALKFDVQPLF